MTRVEYTQLHGGNPVVGGHIAVNVDGARGVITSVIGSFRPVSGVPLTPSIGAEPARAAVPTTASETVREGADLVVWSAYRASGDGSARLAWRYAIEGSEDAREAFVDARDGEVLAVQARSLHALRRSLWDLRATYGGEDCQKWQTPCVAWPSELTGCPAQCNACLTNPEDCATCTCATPSGYCGATPDPASCQTFITRYEEASGCSGCDAESQQLWNDMGSAYAYWSSSFGRDSWDDDGGWLWGKANSTDTGFLGRATPEDVDFDGDYDAVHLTIADNQADPSTHAHELGHALQFGTGFKIGPSFWNQAADKVESHADAHSFRARGLAVGEAATRIGFRCDSDLDHYLKMMTETPFLLNSQISNCHDWLLANDSGSPSTHHGITIDPVSSSTFDQIWYRALTLYSANDDTLFDWWNAMVQAAFDVCGGTFCSAYQSTAAARDAVGGPTQWAPASVGVTSPRPMERIAAVGWAGAPTGPCIFYRYTGWEQAIYWSCRTASGSWTTSQVLNDPQIDPAASGPAAAFRYENGTNYIYVLWRGAIGDRLQYRRIDLGSMTVGPPAHMTHAGLPLETCDTPSVAPIFESAAFDRLMVVYHPIESESGSCRERWFYATHLDNPDPPQDLGLDVSLAVDSAVEPSLVGYPYWNRVYLFRADDDHAGTPGHLKYLSYTVADGWSAMTDLTALYDAEPLVMDGIVRTEQGVSLAEQGGTPLAGDSRLWVTWLTTGDETSGQREMWMTSLREDPATPGTLVTDGLRPAPMEPLSPSTHMATGGLAPAPTGHPLVHVWGPNVKIQEQLFYGE